MSLSSVIKPVALASLCGLLISTIYFYSREQISLSRFKYETQQLKEVIDNNPEIEIRASLKNDYELWKGDQLFGYIHAMETDQGYNGRITAWLALKLDGEILGVRIKSHRETPGLGDKIDHRVSDWIEQFNGESLKSIPPEKWRIKKDGGKFDQFTGATITPRAVVNMVYQKLAETQSNMNSDKTTTRNSENQ